ncbi:hypothetical protein DT73_12845 [Mangrovibacter sp. MFB070]|uniref:DNA-binding protein n=1 Tax=Mangrovibacter sp. MFB070 TaxID=1224318 RepID=UPI0004D4348A|nr:DNA-binding protein [Mangrovibacter sp. MFB070]KEA51816.1 hypothetical protein DT73_12845 [Mangrovibacter sp. MFB070]
MEWVSANEVAGIAGLPTTPRRTRDTLERMVAGRTELRRKREGSKAFEYHISALPPQVRAEFLTSKGLIETGVGLITLPENNKKTVASAESFERQKLWQHWEKASNEQRLRAEHRAKAVALVAELQDSGLTGGTRSVDFARLFSRVAKKVVINNIKAGDVDAFCDAWNVAGKDERQLLKAIAKRPGALRSLSHILPLAHIYASGKGEPVNTGHIHSAMLELGHADVNGE